MNQSETIGELAKALCVVQAQLRPAKMDAENPYFKSKYATLESCWNACRDLLSSNGLAVVQSPGSDGNGRIEVRSTLVHTSGEWMSATVSLKPVKDDPQAAGSAITYGRRYGLCALVGIVTNDDDDANACSAPRETKPTPKQKCAAAIRNRKAILDSSETWSPEQTREQKQKVAQKRADAEALVKDVADTLGAEVVRGSEMEEAVVNAPIPNEGNVRTNPDYKTRNPEINPVKIEARFLQEARSGKSFLYQMMDDGQDAGEIYLPKSQVHSQGRGPDGRMYVWISRWIADEKVKKGKLQPEQIIVESDKDRGDAWEPPPSDSTDVEY